MRIAKLLALGAAGWLAGAALTGAALAKGVNIAWIQGNAVFQAEQRTQAGFQRYLKDKGYTDWTITYLDSGGDAQKVANNIQDAVSRGADVIYVTFADLRASNTVLQSAAEAKIPVYTVDSGWIPGSTADITTNNWQMSAEVSLSLISAMKGKGNLVVFTADYFKPDRERVDTLKAMLKEYPEIKIIAEHDLDITKFYQDTLSTMQDFATRYGKQIDAVWAPWDEPAQAVITALNGAGLHVPVTGMDGHSIAVDAICTDGSMFLATGKQQFEEWGARLAEFAARVKLEGADPKAVAGGRDIIYYPAQLITKDNCKPGTKAQ
ncbi:sugar ABC transporter substrate-binding protein [Labrys neptuniae]